MAHKAYVMPTQFGWFAASASTAKTNKMETKTWTSFKKS